ncbi:hypothetical protein HDV02_001595 [Globomyces sp. JEL0801]|nr:hypothetical protein HDV02_001595 [Globomyces sp. JEL0801]
MEGGQQSPNGPHQQNPINRPLSPINNRMYQLSQASASSTSQLNQPHSNPFYKHPSMSQSTPSLSDRSLSKKLSKNFGGLFKSLSKPFLKKKQRSEIRVEEEEPTSLHFENNHSSSIQPRVWDSSTANEIRNELSVNASNPIDEHVTHNNSAELSPVDEEAVRTNSGNLKPSNSTPEIAVSISAIPEKSSSLPMTSSALANFGLDPVVFDSSFDTSFLDGLLKGSTMVELDTLEQPSKVADIAVKPENEIRVKKIPEEILQRSPTPSDSPRRNSFDQFHTLQLKKSETFPAAMKSSSFSNHASLPRFLTTNAWSTPEPEEDLFDMKKWLLTSPEKDIPTESIMPISNNLVRRKSQQRAKSFQESHIAITANLIEDPDMEETSRLELIDESTVMDDDIEQYKKFLEKDDSVDKDADNDEYESGLDPDINDFNFSDVLQPSNKRDGVLRLTKKPEFDSTKETRSLMDPSRASYQQVEAQVGNLWSAVEDHIDISDKVDDVITSIQSEENEHILKHVKSHDQLKRTEPSSLSLPAFQDKNEEVNLDTKSNLTMLKNETSVTINKPTPTDQLQWTPTEPSQMKSTKGKDKQSKDKQKNAWTWINNLFNKQKSNQKEKVEDDWNPYPQEVIDFMKSRLDPEKEKVIYSISHIKLAQTERPLVQQVQITNLMMYILSVHSAVTLHGRGPRVRRRKKQKRRKSNLYPVDQHPKVKKKKARKPKSTSGSDSSGSSDSDSEEEEVEVRSQFPSPKQRSKPLIEVESIVVRNDPGDEDDDDDIPLGILTKKKP